MISGGQGASPAPLTAEKKAEIKANIQAKLATLSPGQLLFIVVPNCDLRVVIFWLCIFQKPRPPAIQSSQLSRPMKETWRQLRPP